MNKVILVCGSTAAGKSTLSNKISAELKAAVFSIDDWMAELFMPDLGKESDLSWILERVVRCENQIWKECLDLNSKGMNVILDLGFTTAAKREIFYQRLRDKDIPFELQFLDVPRQIRYERVVARNQNKDAHFKFAITPEMFDYIEWIFESPTEEELRLNCGRRITFE